MSESFLQILLYLFSHYMTDEILQPVSPDDLLRELVEVGFSANAAHDAIKWLSGTKNNAAVFAEKQTSSLRIYTTAEMAKIDVKARGFLHLLEQIGVLDGVNRERIVDRAMALPSRKVGLSELRYLCYVLLKNDGPKTLQGQQYRDLLLVEGTKH
jgi:Smg protein